MKISIDMDNGSGQSRVSLKYGLLVQSECFDILEKIGPLCVCVEAIKVSWERYSGVTHLCPKVAFYFVKVGGIEGSFTLTGSNFGVVEWPVKGRISTAFVEVNNLPFRIREHVTKCKNHLLAELAKLPATE